MVHLLLLHKFACGLLVSYVAFFFLFAPCQHLIFSARTSIEFRSEPKCQYILIKTNFRPAKRTKRCSERNVIGLVLLPLDGKSHHEVD